MQCDHIATPQSTETINQKIDAIFADIKAEGPGCNVGVFKNHKILHKAGYGLANMELDVPLDGSQVHRIASVSKQFTGLAVLLLADEGKIDLEDDIRKHLPELRDYNTKVTINAVLGHFSGMGNYDYVNKPKDKESMLLRSSAGGEFRLGNEDYLTINEFYDYVKTVPLRHQPNNKFDYSNYCYFVLSMLVEQVSGESLREYAHKRIFQPLGMNSTFFSDNPVEIVKNRASGYSRSKDGEYFTSMTNLFWVGDGGIHSNIEDMQKWDAYFYQPTLGNNPQQLLTLFNTPNSQLDAFDGKLYANGQAVGEEQGNKVFSHGGGWLGTSTFCERFPEHKISTVIFCNNDRLRPSKYAAEIRKLMF